MDSTTNGLKEQLVGTWSNVSLVARADDGRPFNAFGGNTGGVLVLDSEDRFAIILLGGFRMKFASSNRLEGSAEEYKAMGQGTMAYFGKYSVDESRCVLILHVEACSYANWDATDQVRTISLKGDELTLASPATAAGGTAVVVWRRVSERLSAPCRIEPEAQREQTP